MMVKERVHRETDICQRERAWWRPLYTGGRFSSSGLADESLAQRSTLLSVQYMCINNHVSSQSVLERDSESLRVEMENGERGRERVAQETKRSSPMQTQIRFALLRRQGAEHRVLVDATKPLKTTLHPGMYTPPSHLSSNWHTVYIYISPWRPYWPNIQSKRQVMICSPRDY